MKQIIQKLFNGVGIEIRKKGSLQRSSLYGALLQLRRMGFTPKSIIDIGAAFGDWTHTALSIFPNASYILVEPLEEYDKSLETLASSIPSISIIKGIVGSENGERIMNVHKDLFGSSIFDEVEDDTDLIEEKRAVHSYTLNSICEKSSWPLIIKIDAQGAELEILRGNEESMKLAEVIILETSFFHSVKQAPLFDEVCHFMRENGFVPYDLIGMSYRPLDNALSQVDVVFVKEKGILRNNQAYATKEQRLKQNERFKKKNNTRI
jgi:FkbM family methyltransferase